MPPPPLATSVKERLLKVQQMLDVQLDVLLSVLDAGDQPRASVLWAEFEAGLLAQIQDEEASLIPLLQQGRERDASVLLQEHRHLRTRLREIAASIETGSVPLCSVHDFKDELRAHAHTDNRLLYRRRSP